MRRVLLIGLIGLASPVFSQATSPTAPTEAATAESAAIVERNGLIVQSLYPRLSRRRGEEGEVHFRINVNRDGRLDGCQITQSSGYEALDRATCDMLLKGATATPLVAADGWRKPGWRDGVVPWTLPAGTPRPATPPPLTATRNSAGETLICRRTTKTGSLSINEKLCLTKRDWQRQYEYTQADLREKQMAKGPMSPF